MPDHLFGDLCTPHCAFPINASKNPTVFNSGHAQPVVNDSFHPIRHWDRADMTALSNQVNNGPMVFPTLKMVHRKVNEFFSAKSTAEQHG